MSKKPTYEELEQKVRELENAETECKRSEEALREERAFQGLLLNLATEFINVPLAEFDTVVTDMLRKVGEFTNLDRAYLFMHDHLRRVTSNTHEWCRKGITPEKDNLQETPFDFFSDMLEAWEKGEIVHIPSVARMPEKHAMRKILEQQGIQSLVLVPLIQEENNIGFVGFDAVNQPKSFSDREIALLHVLAEIISNAFARRQAEVELWQSNERLTTVLDSIDAHVYISDMETYEVLFSNHYGRMTWGDSIGKKCWSVFQKDQDGPCTFCTNDMLLDKEGNPAGVHVWEFENTANGRWYDCRDLAVPWIGGRMVRVEIATDITDRKRAEEALRESEEKHRALVDGLPDTVMRFDRDGRHLFVSDKVRDEVDIEPAWFIGKTHSELGFPEAQCLFWEESIRGVFDGGAPFETEFTFEGKASTTVLNWRLVPEFDSQGAVQSVLSISRNITDRKRAEEALRESEGRFRTAMEYLPAGLFAHDLNGRLVMVNEASSRNTGYSRQELLTMSVGDIDRGSMTAEARERMWSELSEGKSVSFESIHLRKDESLYPVELHLSPINLNGQPVILALAYDITERKQSEEERQRLQAQLNQAQKLESVGRLAGGVAHDFNNMLGIILGHTEMALEYLDSNQPVYSDLKEIRKATMRSADLVRQLLAFARKQTVSPRVLDLNHKVEGMLKMLHRLIGEDIKLVWQPGANLWPVNMDPTQIDQILANLCVNARDAIDGVGNVTIATDNVTLNEDDCEKHLDLVPGHYVLLLVVDDGCGMDAGILDKIFDPFFTTKEVGKGTGLGLPTVYGVVKQNQGLISVNSEPGQGATFRIYIPRHIVEAEKEQKQASYEAIRGGDETILLVEDEPMLLQMGKDVLKRLGYRVIAAGSPSEALRIAVDREEDIQLLITDVIMPGMNGRELADQLLESYPDMKLVFISGYTAEAISHHGVLDPGVKFVQKPFSIRDLARQIREALEG